jgi:hypothetical protein
MKKLVASLVVLLLSALAVSADNLAAPTTYGTFGAWSLDRVITFGA